MDNYFGRKEKFSTTSMLTNNFNQTVAQNISLEVLEGFKMISQVINQSEMLNRCKNLDKHRNNEYWKLADEMAARSF